MNAPATIWVTRPEPQATACANALMAAGFDAIAAPVMEIHPKEEWKAPEKKPDAIIITSQQAADALKLLPNNWKNLPVYVVGDKSAEAVKALGWTPHKPTESGAIPMLALIESEQKKDAHLLYLAGNILRWDIPALLEEKGYHADPLTVYTSKAVESLPESVQHAIGEDRLAALTCFSPRSAEIAAKLLKDNEHGHLLATMTAMCISEDCVDAARKVGFTHTTLATGTGTDAMVQLAASKNPDTGNSMSTRRQSYGIFVVLVAVIALTGLLAWQNIQMQTSMEQVRSAEPSEPILTATPEPTTMSAPEPAPAAETEAKAAPEPTPQAEPEIALGQLRAELQQEIATIKENARSEMASSVAALEAMVETLQAEKHALAEEKAAREAEAAAKAASEKQAQQEAQLKQALAAVPKDLYYSWYALLHAYGAGKDYQQEIAALQGFLIEPINQSPEMQLLVRHADKPAPTRDALVAQLVKALDKAPSAQPVQVIEAAPSDEVGVMARMQHLLDEHVTITRAADVGTQTMITKVREHIAHDEIETAARILHEHPKPWPALRTWLNVFDDMQQRRLAIRQLGNIIASFKEE